MLKSIFGLVEDAAKIVLAPIEIAVDLTRAVTKPVADLAQEAAQEIKSVVEGK